MNHKSRIEEYKKLREEIEKIDVYSFDDPKKYPIKKNENIVEIHDLDEKDEYPEEKKIEKDHIKKNTLSLSIDELIRRHEAYTETLQKEEIEKKLKENKERKKLNNKFNISLRTFVWAFCIIIVVVIIIIVGLVIGGVLWKN